MRYKPAEKTNNPFSLTTIHHFLPQNFPNLYIIPSNAIVCTLDLFYQDSFGVCGFVLYLVVLLVSRYTFSLIFILFCLLYFIIEIGSLFYTIGFFAVRGCVIQFIN